MGERQEHHETHLRKLIEVEAIIVAYAMSRLDAQFLMRFSYESWREAFRATGSRLGVPPASMKNLRDEFDPLHPNGRKGWHKRRLRRTGSVSSGNSANQVTRL